MTPADPLERTIRAPLYVPAHRRNMVEKALSGVTGADTIIVDLEDGVPREDRGSAEETMRWLSSSVAPGIPLFCRIRPAADAASDDLGLVPPWARGVLLAKAEDPKTVEAVTLAAGSIECWLLIESGRGIEFLPSLLSGPPVAGLMLGGTDLRADLRARHTEDGSELMYSRGRLISVAAAFGIRQVIDTPEGEIHNTDRLAQVTHRAKLLGFTGKACIHPTQVGTVLAEFAPTSEEAQWARAVLESGDGAQRVGGELVDEATKRQAREILGGMAET